MRKILLFLFAYFFTTIIACCSSDGIGTYKTVESVAAFLLIVDSEGNQFANQVNPEEVNFKIFADSVSIRQVFTSVKNLSGSLMACDDPDFEMYTNRIDSIQIFTVFDYNENFPAESNISNICESSLSDLAVNEYYIEYGTIFSVLQALDNDSIQLKITGIITEIGPFTIYTDLVTIDE